MVRLRVESCLFLTIQVEPAKGARSPTREVAGSRALDRRQARSHMATRRMFLACDTQQVRFSFCVLKADTQGPI